MAVTSYPIKKIAGGKGPFYDYEFKGLSTDTKPIKDIPVNSLFWEMDTGDMYYLATPEGISETTLVAENTFTFEPVADGIYASLLLNGSSFKKETIKVFFDDEEYDLSRSNYYEDANGYVCTYGEFYDESEMPLFSTYPFAIMNNYQTYGDERFSAMYITDSNTHKIKIVSVDSTDAVWAKVGGGGSEPTPEENGGGEE